MKQNAKGMHYEVALEKEEDTKRDVA